MIIDFRQGIITYPTSGNLQRFLEFSDGFVTLNAADGRIDVTMAHGDENYLHTESTTVNAAWGPITPNVDAWLYWNLNGLTAHRTFGVTYIQPQYGPTAPSSPVNDLHWFDTTNNIMRVYTSGKWVTRIRVFACKINNATITPLGAGIINRPFAGTQVGLTGVNIPVGRIIVDSVGQPIRKQNGQLFTTEDEFFINGSPINTIRLEANVLQAEAVENIARFQPVKFVDFGKIALAKYDDTYTTAIAMAMEDIHQGSVGTLCMQGVITNPEWNWDTVGKPLWIHGSIPGLLTDVDPHVSNAPLYKTAKPPVARVISRTSVFFDQGLGGKGDKGDAGDAGVSPATTVVLGVVKLSTDAADPENPIVVGDNDIRNFNDRYPLPHNQPATTIIPDPVGILTGVTLQNTLQIINDSFVKRAGDTMSGYLTLHAHPALPMHAATKAYVDGLVTKPAGDTTQIQFNRDGAFDASPTFTYATIAVSDPNTNEFLYEYDRLAVGAEELLLTTNHDESATLMLNNYGAVVNGRVIEMTTRDADGNTNTFHIGEKGDWHLNGDDGVCGQVLTSQGPDVQPMWIDMPYDIHGGWSGDIPKDIPPAAGYELGGLLLMRLRVSRPSLVFAEQSSENWMCSMPNVSNKTPLDGWVRVEIYADDTCIGRCGFRWSSHDGGFVNPSEYEMYFNPGDRLLEGTILEVRIVEQSLQVAGDPTDYFPSNLSFTINMNVGCAHN